MTTLKRVVSTAAVVACVVGSIAAQEPQTYRPGQDGVSAPQLVRETKAQYTEEARSKRIQGIVQLEAVVLEDGTVGDVKVTKSLDDKYGLDDAAVAALKQWFFKPGRKDGKAVKVAVSVEMSFTLK